LPSFNRRAYPSPPPPFVFLLAQFFFFPKYKFGLQTAKWGLKPYKGYLFTPPHTTYLDEIFPPFSLTYHTPLPLPVDFCPLLLRRDIPASRQPDKHKVLPTSDPSTFTPESYTFPFWSFIMPFLFLVLWNPTGFPPILP